MEKDFMSVCKLHAAFWWVTGLLEIPVFCSFHVINCDCRLQILILPLPESSRNIWFLPGPGDGAHGSSSEADGQHPEDLLGGIKTRLQLYIDGLLT